jgi:hypothetical protein
MFTLVYMPLNDSARVGPLVRRITMNPTPLRTFLLATTLLLACSDVATSPRSALSPASSRYSAAVAGGASANGAGVFIDLAGACGMFDGNGNIVGPLDANINVVTQSSNGNAVQNCFTTVDNPTGRAIRYDADHNPFGVRIACAIRDDAGNVVFTFNVHEQISASGRAHLICVANGRP